MFTEGYRKMKLRAVSGMMLTLLLTGMLSASFEIRETSANPTVRIYVEMPPQGYIPGIPVNTVFDVEVYIDSPPEWTNTSDGIVGWRMDVQVNGSVLQPWDVLGAASGYFLRDFIDAYWVPANRPEMTYETITTDEWIDVAEGIKGYDPPEGIGVGAGGSGLLCKLQVKSKSETAYTLIDLIDVRYWTVLSGGWLPADVVIDGHYNARAPDNMPPTISIISPENKTHHVRDVPLTFTVSESTSWIGYSLDGQANITIAGNTTLTGLSDGTHSLEVYARDMAGNIGSSDMVYFTIQISTVDTTPPSISIVSPENRTYGTADIPLTFTVDESVSWMAYSLDGQTNVTITGNTTLFGLSEGSHSLMVYAKDVAGNTGASDMVYFNVETPPEPEPEPEPAESSQLWIVAAIVITAAVGAALLVYFAKVKKTRARNIRRD